MYAVTITATDGRYPSSSATRFVWTRAASATVAGYSACVHASAASEPQSRTTAAITAATLAPWPGDQVNGPMWGSRGRVSEKASDFPEPGATARSQSFFVAFSFIVARKMPLLLATMLPTVRQFPPLP